MPDNIRTTYKVGIAAVILIIVWIITPTVAEFIIAGWNRYDVYPRGTDSNMLGNWLIAQGFLLYIVVMLVFRYLFRFNAVTTILGGLLLAGVLSWFVQFNDSFIPNSWCKHELKIYSCSALETGIDIID